MNEDKRFAQLYRVLTDDAHLEAGEAADMVDSLMSATYLDPTHAQAIIMDRIGEFGWDIETYLFRDCCYAAWTEASAKEIGIGHKINRMSAAWVNMMIGQIEHAQGPMATKWQRLAEFCKHNELETLDAVAAWAEQPVAKVIYA